MSRRFAMEIDPEAPGLFGILKGERGIVWQQFVLIALGTLGSLAVIAALAILA